MLLHYGLQVVCAAIPDFYVVFVENLVVPVIFRKMLTDKVQKLSGDVCLYVHAVGRIKPNYLSLSVLAAVLCRLDYRFPAFIVDWFSFVSTLFKCTFYSVFWLCRRVLCLKNCPRFVGR